MAVFSGPVDLHRSWSEELYPWTCLGQSRIHGWGFPSEFSQVESTTEEDANERPRGCRFEIRRISCRHVCLRGNGSTNSLHQRKNCCLTSLVVFKFQSKVSVNYRADSEQTTTTAYRSILYTIKKYDMCIRKNQKSESVRTKELPSESEWQNDQMIRYSVFVFVLKIYLFSCLLRCH